MESGMKRTVFFIVILIGLLVLTGCRQGAEVGELTTETETIDLGGAEQVEVQIRMGAGELRVQGGATALADATFAYNVAVTQPEVDYQVEGNLGVLEIRQPAALDFEGLTGYEYRWDIALNEEVPMALDVELGAGNNVLDVGSLNLTELDVSMGAGEVDLDLIGDWQNDLEVNIQGGVGSLNVRVPEDMGVRVEVTGGLGNIVATGLSRGDGAFVNEAYGEAGPTLTIDIEGGVGEVQIQTGQ